MKKSPVGEAVEAGPIDQLLGHSITSRIAGVRVDLKINPSGEQSRNPSMSVNKLLGRSGTVSPEDAHGAIWGQGIC